MKRRLQRGYDIMLERMAREVHNYTLYHLIFISQHLFLFTS